MNIAINKINGLLGHYTASKYRGIMPISQQNTPDTLKSNPKSLNSNWHMRVHVYSRVNSREIKKEFQNLQIKRSFSKMPFSKMYNCMIYLLTRY